jgi:integrase
MARRRTGRIEKRDNGSYRIRYTTSNGKRQNETYKTLTEAERALAERLASVAKGAPVSATAQTVLFAELCADVITDYQVNGFSSVDDIETRFRLHLVPVFGHRRASDISTKEIKQYILDRRKEGTADGCINREMEAMRHTFNLAIREGRIFQKPFVPMAGEDKVRTGFFTREEVSRLASHLPTPLAEMVWFGFLTGWRLEEIKSLEWRNVDLKTGQIRIDVGEDKNRAGRVIPMSAQVRSLLESLKTPHTINPYVFRGVGEFRKTWKTACYKAGLPCDIAPIQIRSKVQNRVKVLKAHRTFHDLRRSFAREMSNRGIREGAIMKFAGWKTRSVFDRYNIVSEADLHDAVEKMDDHPTTSPQERS